jgi:prepilin-type N-terminal cleavage/methylation domain-containing protein
MITHTIDTRHERGFTLVELLVTVAITLVIMGATMTALGSAWKANESAVLVTGLNSGLRTAMDIVVRDLLQTGQGLPTGRFITIPSGAGATAIRLPGPPGMPDFTLPTTTTELNAVMPRPGAGPVINNVATDVITVLAADSSFDRRALTALTNTSMTVALNRARQPLTGLPLVREEIRNGANISDGATNAALAVDDIDAGDLIMLTRGSLSALVQVTGVSGQVITFAGGDSLNLNQNAAADGTVSEYRDTDPVTAGIQAEAIQAEPYGWMESQATRIRMITYYVDARPDPTRPLEAIRPKLVRRMNNGHATTFNNTLGTAVAFDIEAFQVTYDLADGVTNPTNVRLTLTDLQDAANSACKPAPPAAAIACDLERVRKVNVLLAGRARRPMRGSNLLYRNSLVTQVSLRSLAFVDRYE